MRGVEGAVAVAVAVPGVVAVDMAEKISGIEVMQQERPRFVALALRDQVDEAVVERSLPTRMLGGATDTAQFASHFADQVERVDGLVGDLRCEGLLQPRGERGAATI